MRKIILLVSIVLFASCSQPITPEEKARLTTEIQTLDGQVESTTLKLNGLSDQTYSKEKKLSELNSKISEAKNKLGIIESGHTPRYVLSLHFQEHKMEVSFDRISFDFEVPVDEQFYNESKVGEELGSGSRTWSFGHSGDITVIGKRIQ